MNAKRGWVAAGLLAAVTALSGCGGETRPSVEGTVSYNGEPVDLGSITLVPRQAGPKVGGAIRDGKFAIDPKISPVPGTYGVELQWMKKTGKKVQGEAGELDERAQALPAKYNEKSELTAEIKPGPNVLTFDLKP